MEVQKSPLILANQDAVRAFTWQSSGTCLSLRAAQFVPRNRSRNSDQGVSRVSFNPISGLARHLGRDD